MDKIFSVVNEIAFAQTVRIKTLFSDSSRTEYLTTESHIDAFGVGAVMPADIQALALEIKPVN